VFRNETGELALARGSFSPRIGHSDHAEAYHLRSPLLESLNALHNQ
jgi:hypothetical protein